MRRALAGTALVVLLAGCAGPSLEPIGDDPDGTAAGGPVDGCRPALGEDDAHPIGDGGGPDPGLQEPWVSEIARQVQTEHTDVLGGVWLDQDEGELVVMVPGTEGREVFERLRQEAPEPERVVCMEATHTEDELRGLQEQVAERLSTVGPAMSAVDTVRSHLDVEVEGDPEEARDALGELADHPAVRLEVPDCARVEPPPEDATPLPGGASNCSGMTALFTGTLVGDAASGCAWFEDDQDQPRVVVWPRGWSLSEDGTVIDHRGEERATIGDRIESGGGNAPLGEGQRACGSGGDEGAWVVSSLDRAGEDDTGE